MESVRNLDDRRSGNEPETETSPGKGGRETMIGAAARALQDLLAQGYRSVKQHSLLPDQRNEGPDFLSALVGHLDWARGRLNDPDVDGDEVKIGITLSVTRVGDGLVAVAWKFKRTDPTLKIGGFTGVEHRATDTLLLLEK